MGCFNCPRTCRTEEKVDVCRFMPLLEAMGVTATVTSHTATVECKIKSTSALAAAVRSLGGTVLGQGKHMLRHNDMPHEVAGFGVKLPGWHYPLVLTAEGKLAYETDDESFAQDGLSLAAVDGNWARRSGPKIDAVTVGKLTGKYMLAAAREAGIALGWRVITESDGSVTVKHRSGGSLRVSEDGKCEAFGFTGTDCHATKPIEEFLGSVTERRYKPEYHAVTVHRRVKA